MSNELLNAYNNFNKIYDDSISLIRKSIVFFENQIEFDDIRYSNDMHCVIVEQSFMKIYLALENFLENSFIAYLLGDADLQSNEAIKFAAPKDRNHAYDMIRGTKQYPDWTNVNDVKQLAKIYFKDSWHYSILFDLPSEFNELKIIRNRISHISEKSEKSFNTVLSKNIAKNNITPGEYLQLFKDKNNTYFTFYCEMIKGYVDAISNTSI